jgi:sRNA-binding protein
MRIALDGTPAQPVDDRAREYARARLAKLAARKLARERERELTEKRLEKLAARALERRQERELEKLAPREKRKTAPPTPSPGRISRTVSRFAGHLNDSTQASCSPTPTNPASQPERLGIAGLKAAAQQRRAAAAGR